MRSPLTRVLVLAGVVAVTASAPAAAQELPNLDAPAAERDGSARSIAQASSKAEDRAIEERLREIFGQVEGLGAVAVEVNSGVIRLSGEVLSGRAREKAVRIAGQLQGAVEVQDQLVETRSLERRLRPILADLRERSMAFVGTLPLLVVSLLVFAFFLVLGRFAAARDAPYRRLTRNPFAQDLLRQAVHVGFVVVGAVLALEVLDATTVVAAVAGVAGLAGLAVSFAFRDLAENYIASVLLSLRQPFLADEHVVIEGHEGRVVRLTLRATILIDLDGNHVRIPNAKVFKNTILNYSRNPLRRFGFVVGVATDADVSEALGLGVGTLKRMPGVVADPAPQAWVESLGDWNVGLRFTAWIDQRETGWFKARGEAMRLVKQAFDAGGIVMPEPALSVRAPTSATREPGAVAQPAATPPPIELAVDISPDTQVEHAIEKDRASAGGDLLDPRRPRE